MRFFKNLIRDESGGVALILVIWVLVILIAIVGEFSYSMRTELNITRNFKEEEEAYQLALAGIERAKIEILSAKEPLLVFLNKDNILVFGEEDELPVREGKLGRGTFSYKVTDEDGKLNINSASHSQVKYVITGTGVDITDVDTIVDSIIDWRDTNDLHMLNGAEEDYYQSLEMPYSCKDGPFDIIEELLLVKGITPDVFYGSGEKKEEKESHEGLVHFFTTWGSNKVNINTAPEKVLEAVFGIAGAENIIIQREAGPIPSLVSGGSVRSLFFTIISTGTTIDGTIKRSIKTTFKKNVKELEVLYWNDNFIGQI